MRVQSFVFIQRLNGNAPPNAGTDNLPRQDAGLRSNYGAALHADVIAKADLTANHAIVFYSDAAADTRLRGDHDVLADVTVVTDMDHVVQLCSFSNPRAA